MEDPSRGLFETAYVLRIWMFSFCRRQNVLEKKQSSSFNVVGEVVTPFTPTPMGRGGLAILWNPTTVIIDNPFSTVGTIMTHFKVIGSTKEGEITNAYGPQSTQDKENFLK
jgi:hypothetical protein